VLALISAHFREGFLGRSAPTLVKSQNFDGVILCHILASHRQRLVHHRVPALVVDVHDELRPPMGDEIDARRVPVHLGELHLPRVVAARDGAKEQIEYVVREVLSCFNQSLGKIPGSGDVQKNE
jgi:hypothetical protein